MEVVFVVRANHSFAVALRKAGQVELLRRRLNDLARADFAGPPGRMSTRIFAYWLAFCFAAGTHTHVAEADGRITGTYILRPNQSGGGSHVANARSWLQQMRADRG